MIPKLKNGLIDIIIFNNGGTNFGEDIKVINCKKIQDTFVVNEDYIDLTKKEISLKELNNYPLIMQPKGSNTRYFIDNIAREHGVILKPNMELASFTLVSEFTKIGLGIGYLTKDYIKKYIDDKELFELKIKEKIPNRYIGIALSKNHIPNFSTKKLIEIINKKED
jgi:DNA-binding transcriptional LysR family regulator